MRRKLAWTAPSQVTATQAEPGGANLPRFGGRCDIVAPGTQYAFNERGAEDVLSPPLFVSGLASSLSLIAGRMASAQGAPEPPPHPMAVVATMIENQREACVSVLLREGARDGSIMNDPVSVMSRASCHVWSTLRESAAMFRR